MENLFKNLIAGVIIVIVLIALIDGYRLKTQDLGTKPLVTVKELEEKEDKTYYGLGYSIYYQGRCDHTEGMESSCGIHYAEFRLFYKMVVWTKVE